MNISDLDDDAEKKVYEEAFFAAPVGSENDAAEAAVMEYRSKKTPKEDNLFEKRRKAVDSFF